MSEFSSGRVLGVDLGSKRIGIAVSDARRTLASPLTVLQRSGNVEADHRALAKLIAEEEATLMVVGMPTDLKGQKAIAAKAAEAEIKLIASRVDVPVQAWDERMTSAGAHRQLKELGLNEKKRREVIDKWAAASILQGWLDHQTKSHGL